MSGAENRGCTLPPLHYIESNVINPALKATGISTVTKTIATIFEDIGKLFTPDTSTDTARTKKKTSNSTPKTPYSPYSPIRTRSEFNEFRDKLYQYDGDDPNFYTRQFELFLDKKTSPKKP